MLEVKYKNLVLDIDYFLHQGEEKTLLYLHAGACSKEDFVEATKNELKRYTIVGFDFPGCGGSNYPTHQAFDVDDLVEITRLVVKKLNLSDIVIVGHSLGGLVALLYIEKYDETCAFINVEGNLAEENCIFSRQVAQNSFSEFKNEILPNLLKALRASKNKGLRKWADSLEGSSPQAFYDCCASLVEYSVHGDLLNKYMDLSIPTLYIYGSENKQDLKLLDRLKQQACETNEISNSNHFLFHDNPNEFYDAISNFIHKSERCNQERGNT